MGSFQCPRIYTAVHSVKAAHAQVRWFGREIPSYILPVPMYRCAAAPDYSWMYSNTATETAVEQTGVTRSSHISKSH